MTGLECLREEMKKRGCCKAQIESKTAAIVLDILANGNGIYTDLAAAEEKAEILRLEISNLKGEHKRITEALKQDHKKLTFALLRAEEKIEEERRELEEAKSAILEMETPGARDAERKAYIFKKMCDVQTKYDNTAFINGLAAILAGKKPEAAE